MTAYIDTFRSVVLTPDNITLLADGVSDTLTINADANKGLSLSASADGSDTLDLNVNYNLFVPIGTTILRLQDVNSNTKDITLTAGANITVTRNSASELVLSSTVGGNSKAIGGATAANPVVITTSAAHGFTEGTPVTITDVAGMTQLNGNEYYMDILTSDTFALYTDANLSTSLDGTAFSAYTSGGVSTAEYQTTNLSQMGDVLLTSPSVGKVLYHNGAKWVDQIIDTSVITENTNLFYTNTRVDNRFDTRLALKSTDDLAEGTNLYYTDTRTNSAIDARVTTSFVNGLAGLNSALVGGLDASAFLRSDAADTHTHTITPAGDRGADLGSTTKRYDKIYGAGIYGDVIGNLLGDIYSGTPGNSYKVYESDTGLFTGDVQGDLWSSASDSTKIIDAYYSNFYGTTFGNHIGNINGSVFGDDSSLLVDGINGRLVMANNTTDDLAEGSNNKYFTNGRAIAMTIVFG